MAATFTDCIARAVDRARRHAQSFPGSVSADALPWAVIEMFDAEIRGGIERDRRIEDERDRVLIAAVALAETPPGAADAISVARAHLVDAIDYLEQAVVRFGVVDHRGARRGLGPAGQRAGVA